jgi:general nucleoside transport system permease protein
VSPDRNRFGASLLALLVAFAIGALLLSLVGQDPVRAFSALLSGALGSDGRLGETLVNTVPLILTGLAVAVGFRAGLFNIGAEGQLLLGAVSVAWLAPLLPIPGFLSVPLMIAVGAVAGALWALIPGLLKARLGANEVITTLMLSYVAYYLTEFLIVGPLKAPGVLPATPTIGEANRIPRVGDALANLGVSGLPDNFLGRLHLGLPIALLVAAAVSYLLWRTVPGFTIRVMGQNPEAATYGGVDVRRTIVTTMLLSGAIAGIAGAIQVLGVHHRMSSSFSAGFGFTGIAVALLGNVAPLGVVLAALLFGVLQTGGQVMQRTADTPASIVAIIQGLVIFLVAVQVRIPRRHVLGWMGRARTRAATWRS